MVVAVVAALCAGGTREQTVTKADFSAGFSALCEQTLHRGHTVSDLSNQTALLSLSTMSRFKRRAIAFYCSLCICYTPIHSRFCGSKLTAKDVRQACCSCLAGRRCKEAQLAEPRSYPATS